MTRINLVDPSHLSDLHCLAEFKELPRIFTAVRKLLGQGKKIEDVVIPERYVLGEGHCKFFYNKIYWLRMRYSEIANELMNRGFNLNEDLYQRIVVDSIGLPDGVMYHPTPEEIYLSMSRLCRRSKMDRVLFELESDN